ncbi:helix-turn-helix domain-containing protein [Amycolatopsis anabasis]|uniref:helix-turn-helix domain-containing protein n=1 Tax=Amycolatopsis anabasis TaxID=1840409 RepID=UPI00131C4FD2|nr:helix-turn-helix transcriptional regulator [Amycolatopsis anabasis]
MSQTELATLLHTLKGRTNRSYESLARRVGISSSSLHRYCRGESVPPSFEVIGRFGRVCGASRAELNELLRAWARAADPGDASAGEGPGSTDSPRVGGPGPRSRSRRQALAWLGLAAAAAGVVGVVVDRINR